MAFQPPPPGPTSWEHWRWLSERQGAMLHELTVAFRSRGTPWRTTAELARATGYTRPMTRLALAVLRRRGMVKSRRLSPWPWARQWRLTIVPGVES